MSSGPPAERLVTLPEGWPHEHGIPTLGVEAYKWATKLTQPNGPRAGRPFRFTREQTRFLMWWYALDGEAQWLFHHSARRLSKGTGKSPFAGVWALIEFCAPVRLERFDGRADGGCVGRPVLMPLVQIAATAESQTANTMRMVRAFAPKGSAVVREHLLDPGKQRYYKQPEGTLEVITSSAVAAEGAESTAVVGDETENWTATNGGDDLASTLEDNLAKSGSRMLETANAWVPGIGSVAEATWDAWVAQEEGRVRGEGRILYDARLAPPGTDLADPASLKRALIHIYADCDWKKPHGADGEPDRDAEPDVQPIMNRIWSPKSKPSESQRKYLNWPTVAADAWTTPQEWALLHDPSRRLEDGEDVGLFFDGSKSRDATALLGCTIEDGHVFRVDVWEPDPADPEDVVPVADVDLTVAQVFGRFRVAGFFGDVKEWESFVKVSWPELYAEGLDVWAVPGGKDPQPIAWDMRSHTMDFTRECELVEAEIREGAFTHDGDPTVARHVGNARRRPNRWGVSIGKETPDSPRKIDAAVCMIGARMVRRLVLAERAKHPAPKKAGRLVGWG